MLIHHPKAFWRGVLLLATFAGVFVLILSPIFPSEYHGKNTNGLVYADHMFNTLSKGSANFFDKTLTNKKSVNAAIQRTKDKKIELTFPLPNQESVTNALNLFEQIGITASAEGQKTEVTEATESADQTATVAATEAADTTTTETAAVATAETAAADTASRRGINVTIKDADLFVLLNAMVNDSELLYHNDDTSIASQYSMDGRLVIKTWWQVASAMIKPMQRVDLISEAAIVHTVQTKGIEASYNFYGITAEKVSDNIFLVIAFLMFYVVYTMWYGFSIFEIFDGIGLSMNKGKKQEA